jgi:DNA-directed RNA polymerase sigma subunit (sigma70/sigma32)
MSPKYDSMRKVNVVELLEFIKRHQHEPSRLTDWSLKEIGDKFGISGARVHQIKKKYGRGEL